jgi:hypothetical protein
VKPNANPEPKIQRTELPVSPACPEPRVLPEPRAFPVSPVSNGQDVATFLKLSAARNRCRPDRNTPEKQLWELARDAKLIERKAERQLTNGELMSGFKEWHRLSESLLDPAKSDDYFAFFLARIPKVRVPTGGNATLQRALKSVSLMPPAERPQIPDYPNAPESWRILAALHRELSRLTAGGVYFLTCRDAAKTVPGMSHQAAYNINLALVHFGVIKIVRVGDTGPNGKRASEFQYLLPQNENRADEDEGGFDL